MWHRSLHLASKVVYDMARMYRNSGFSLLWELPPQRPVGALGSDTFVLRFTGLSREPNVESLKRKGSNLKSEILYLAAFYTGVDFVAVCKFANPLPVGNAQKASPLVELSSCAVTREKWHPMSQLDYAKLQDMSSHILDKYPNGFVMRAILDGDADGILHADSVEEERQEFQNWCEKESKKRGALPPHVSPPALCDDTLCSSPQCSSDDGEDRKRSRSYLPCRLFELILGDGVFLSTRKLMQQECAEMITLILRRKEETATTRSCCETLSDLMAAGATPTFQSGHDGAYMNWNAISKIVETCQGSAPDKEVIRGIISGKEDKRCRKCLRLLASEDALFTATVGEDDVAMTYMWCSARCAWQFLSTRECPQCRGRIERFEDAGDLRIRSFECYDCKQPMRLLHPELKQLMEKRCGSMERWV